MSEPAKTASTAPIAAPRSGATDSPAQKLVSELKVSAHLMALDPGLFCIVHTPSSPRNDPSGLPGVRVSLPPGQASRPESVTIASFRPDGWLSGQADAALVRVVDGPAQVLVTVYQNVSGVDTAPKLQVMRLADAAPTAPQPAPRDPAPARTAAPLAATTPMLPGRMPEMVAHVQVRGDVGAGIGEWIGERGSKLWIEGFMIAPQSELTPEAIEYQAVLGRGWLSPWVDGGQMCGSRGMALPVLGLRVRLKGPAAETHECRYAASFVDGTEIGPVGPGEPCEAESLAPMEAFQLLITPRIRAAAKPKTAEPKRAEAKPAAPAKPVAKPRPAPKRR